MTEYPTAGMKVTCSAFAKTSRNRAISVSAEMRKRLARRRSSSRVPSSTSAPRSSLSYFMKSNRRAMATIAPMRVAPPGGA